ncbi:MAG: bifunctional acetaldehyde-CoA/alcohol dehydrogenase [Candidatus Obscuribacterales bacterium]|nr:bifunctional acetaldehyde-CoA/alcohol dehydrogenase [Candidatus Obscuribacterales bacterium]
MSQQQSVGASTSKDDHERSLIEHVNHMVRQARLASAVFTQYSQEDVDRIVKAMTLAALEHVYTFAQMAHEETRMGQVEDKMLKDFVASEFLYNQIKDKRTVGVVREFPEDNMVEIAEPMGVILALSPVTNPTSTIIFKSLCAAKTRNSIIFSPHLMAANCSNFAAKVLYEAALSAGAPKGFISWVEKSSRLRKETELMMVHPDVDLIFATGGTQMVRAAHSSGKPAIGVGAGNTPVYIHKSAFIEGAVTDIIISKTFDNGTECPSEQTLVLDREIYDEALNMFNKLGCYVCNEEEVQKVVQTVIDQRTKGMNYKFVGQPAKLIADAAGIKAADDVKILLCPLQGELRHHPLAVEKLMPVLGVVAVDSVDEGINRALDINYAGGTGHTSGIFATDEAVIEEYATAINAGRVIVNSPTSIGGLGGVYNNLNTTLSFGCGTGGGNITTDNVGVQNLLNYKRVPHRKNFVLSFQTTKNIYINPGSIDHLRGLKTKSAFVVTSGSAASRGHLSMVLERLPENCRVDVFSQVGVEPDFSTVEKAVTMMRKSQPDTIIALGGGSVLDAAKIMRLFYDWPNLKLSEVATPFLDFRQRVVKFPVGDSKTQLVAIPTTSGTGSEVTPFAVLKDNQSHSKYSLVDESLLPDVAILDAQLTRSLPPQITVDTAIDALTHALEALVSIMSSDYTDGLALEAIRLIFEALPEAVKNGSNVVWRHKLHNAACLAGMAIGNASVGVNHALAHSLGARFDIPHGRANSVFLLSTLEYNSQVPRKITPHSTHTHFVAPKKYARAARFLGLGEKQPGISDEELVILLRRAVFDLLSELKQPMCIQDLGIPVKDLQDAGEELVKASFQDMSLRTNPRLALISDIKELFIKSYPSRIRP